MLNRKKFTQKTNLDETLLNWFSKKYPEVSEQIKSCNIKKREYTGAGFFFELKVAKNTESIDEKIRNLEGPDIKSNQLEFEAGSILFLEKGYIKMLEVFSYGTEFPKNLDTFELK